MCIRALLCTLVLCFVAAATTYYLVLHQARSGMQLLTDAVPASLSRPLAQAHHAAAAAVAAYAAEQSDSNVPVAADAWH